MVDNKKEAPEFSLMTLIGYLDKEIDKNHKGQVTRVCSLAYDYIRGLEKWIKFFDDTDRVLSLLQDFLWEW